MGSGLHCKNHSLTESDRIKKPVSLQLAPSLDQLANITGLSYIIANNYINIYLSSEIY